MDKARHASPTGAAAATGAPPRCAHDSARPGHLEGEYHWHKHDAEDEFFLVLDGELLIDVEARDTVVLGRHLGFTVPRGVAHRTRAPARTVVLMVEAATVTPTGDP
ncbi:MAG TPA: cupin domain-containing protein [Anaeromyxobacter sp.]|nr:cupin domain-containing protein [Anaeromyxobacter sp.]